MATVATAMYSHSFGTNELDQSPSIQNSSTTSQSHPMQPQEEQLGEDDFNTCFCRALYDYEAQDASALSFRRDDIIEVLTKQPSGWWDGLLGEERGWFPSNYVDVISEEEAEQYFAQADFSAADSQSTAQPIVEEPVDTHRALASGSQSENEEWLHHEVGLRAVSQEPPRPARTAGQPSDFWIPDVTSDGQIYYVNTITGQRSRDLPQEAEEDVSDGDLTGFTSQTTSRSGTSTGLAFGASDAESGPEDIAGKQIASSVWVKQLADDGVSQYYLNIRDGRIQWSAPEGFASSPPRPSRSASAFPSAISRQPDTSRLSVYSDDSDIQPFDHLPPARARQNGKSRHAPAAALNRSEPNAVAMQLTSAERIAKALQHALEPPPPNLLTDLSAIARATISTVVENVRVLAQQPDGDINMDQLIQDVVLAIRNLLYISAHTPSQLQHPPGRDGRNHTITQSPLKPAQRKVTATLSRLVLSARAIQYDSGSQLGDTLTRIETDSQELERAVLAFVLEVQRSEHSSLDVDSKTQKRLHGVFSTANVGLGLVGAGTAGAWKGFGYVSLDEADMPKKPLDTAYVGEVGMSLDTLQDMISALHRYLRATNDNTVQHVRSHVQRLVTEITAFLALVADVHVARHVDVDGVHNTGDPAFNEHYMQYVENARYLVRTLETVVQAIYDDSSALFTTAQSLPESERNRSPVRGEKEAAYDLLDSLATALNSNLALVKQTFEGLLSVGHEQADVSQGEYNGSIERRMSRLSIINDQFGGALHVPYSANESDHEDFVDVGDMYQAISRPDLRKKKSAITPSYDPYLKHTPSTSYDSFAGTSKASQSSLDKTLVTHSSSDIRADEDTETIYDFEPPKPVARPSGSNKLKQLLGDEYADKMADKMKDDLQPWFLRPNYSPSEIVIEADGSVKGGTVAALVERLTAHEQADTTFSKAFLMTYKSFTSLDELVDLLIERFRIQPPDNLTPPEREQWGKLKQHVIQMRVINTFKSMITDDDVLEKEDWYILDRIQEFVSSDEVSRFAAAKQLNILIERAKSGPEALKTFVATSAGTPPPPIIPKSNKKLKLLEIEPLELARQLTIFESQLYQKIKPIECLQRSREQRTENNDNITIVIQTSNRIADWVAECVLSKEDSRRRAQIVRHLISVADRCRSLNNFSTMIAITSGLNTPPIRRLKRTWDQVNQRFLQQFTACECTIDSNKNFTKYRQLMASVTPPCVPFIGVFLSTLQFIQDGNPDNLPGGLVNFRKRQKASEVISDIKRWQTQSFNLQPVQPILNYITESLNQFSDTKASSEHFWALSLEREPREREDEKMARLLQESGFL